MKSLSTVLLVFIFTIGFVIPSCDLIDDGTNCNCPDIDGAFFRVTEMTSTNYNANEGIMAEGEATAFDNYFIRLEMTPEFYGYTPCRKSTGFSFMNQALACSCIFNGIDGANENIIELSIITKNDFNDLYAANDTISALFNITDDYFGATENVVDFVNRDRNIAFYEGYRLELLGAPSKDSTLEVDIHIKLDNGDEFILENEAVIIQ